MASISKTQGLHYLAKSEKRAAKIISEARQRRIKRLKEAKEEASDMVDNLKEERKKQFLEFEAKYFQSSDDVAQKIDEQTQSKLEIMNEEYNERKKKVIDELLKIVIEDINPKLHRNFIN